MLKLTQQSRVCVIRCSSTLRAEACSLLLRGALLCPCGLKQSTLTEICVVVTASRRATPFVTHWLCISTSRSRRRRRPAVYCNLEGEQCQWDWSFANVSANACVFPVVSCWSVRVCVCVMEAENILRLALLCHSLFLRLYRSIFLSRCFQSALLGVGEGGACHNRDLGTQSSFN